MIQSEIKPRDLPACSEVFI